MYCVRLAGSAGEAAMEQDGKGDRHADDIAGIEAQEAGEGEVRPVAALGRPGDDEAADDEEQVHAEIAVDRDAGDFRIGHAHHRLAGRAAEEDVEEDDAERSHEAENIECRDVLGLGRNARRHVRLTLFTHA